MTPSEFKAWFDGFTEAFSGCPTKAQWARVKERVAEIDGRPVTERVYLDRYLPSYPVYSKTYPSYPITTFTTTCGVGVSQNGALFNSSQAMAELGRAESKSLAS